MGRRITKNDAAFGLIIILILIPIILVVEFVKLVGPFIFLLILGSIIYIIYVYYDNYKKKEEAIKKERIDYLTSKYRNKQIVDRIINQTIWKGETAEQLRDSLDEPASMEKQVLKNTNKETWKYNADGVNRYKLRILLKNGRVIGWKQRD